MTTLRCLARIGLFASSVCFCFSAPLGAADSSEQVQFNRDIRPILSDTCFKCHGPDAQKRQAELRFDQEESARLMRDGRAAIVAGHPEQSELVRRITAADPDERMPPEGSGLK